ncbi:hypothetical protein DLAC_06938 [Tieghemostelium lacteum]|uniref:Uncharacterized protein n=1 Tax=Tieghemostelium lacteum TaxID=361077 RepID=A0A151ZDV1_TIELA|nr:hypothetical protein DLAC_06938 [Tieghemostelium lacteum]|eukprot:KYQ92099.1 hypothetical protein DLAC_06938 [Tieghemostelium lacteum]
MSILPLLLSVLLLPFVLSSVAKSPQIFQIENGNQYTITMNRINNIENLPVLDSFHLQENNPSDQSQWLYNYNVAHCPFVPFEIVKEYPGQQVLGVAVRVQNLTSNPTNIYSVGPSSIVFTFGVCPLNSMDQSGSGIADDLSQCVFNASVLALPEYLITGPQNSNFQYIGAEDPRIVMVNQTLLMYYTGVNIDPQNNNTRAQLSLAMCDTSQVYTVQDFHSCWQLRGPIIENDIFWSKSAGLLYREEEVLQYLFYGDTDIFIAVSENLIDYQTLFNETTGDRVTLFETRDDYFDSVLVESGPEPLQLSDGNWLYLYNSGEQVSTPNQKPNWNIQYNLGYVILNGSSGAFNSQSILYRAEEPLFSPELDWELCDDNSPFWSEHGLTPLVVFIEGWKPLGSDQFLVFYQGCDSVMGTALLTVQIS